MYISKADTAKEDSNKIISVLFFKMATQIQESVKVPQVIERLHEVHSPTSNEVDLKHIESPRWWSLEFVAYYMIIAQALYFGVQSVLSFSSQGHPAYSKYALFLSEGWIPGRNIDLSDRQYGAFRRNLLPLSGLMAAYLALSYIIKRQNADITLKCALGLLFVFVLHGFNVVKIMVIVGVNYAITKRARELRRPLYLWLWALGVLFVTEWFEFPFFPKDLFLGFYKRWNIVFKITVLRMISYGMDYHWYSAGYQQVQSDQRALHKQTCKGCQSGVECEKYQIQFGSKDESDYDWPQYLTYLFYPPLYLAGPIMTFNSFVAQSKQPRVENQYVLIYGLRFLGCLLFFDMFLHYFYVVALKESRAFIGLTAVDFGMLGFFNLKVIWLKLMIIWRYFRTIALLDGINPPENMLRCMSNNYSGMAFWRSWHRSFYLWIVRYLYVPLGGSKAVAWNIWPVFMFVAVWHDLRLHLLAWSWLICLFFIPEILAGYLSRRLQLSKSRHYRTICGLAATASICMMMTANLVGFAVGLDGMKILLKEIVTPRGITFVINALVTMYAAAQIMFEIRAEERRNGIYNNF